MAETNTKSFVKGAAVGALVGSVAALLLAPKSGKETREDIKKLALDLGDKAEAIYLKVKKLLVKKIENIKRAGESIDETKYKDLVGEVVQNLKENKEIADKSATKLGQLLRSDWERVKKEIAK